MQAGVTMAASLALPYVTRLCGLRPVYCFAQLVLASSLFLTAWVKTEVGAVTRLLDSMTLIVTDTATSQVPSVLIGIFGIPWTVTMVCVTCVCVRARVCVCVLNNNSVNNGCSKVFPFSLVAMSVGEEASGLYIGWCIFACVNNALIAAGVLNIFVVLPQICVAAGIGFIMNAFGGNVAFSSGHRRFLSLVGKNLRTFAPSQGNFAAAGLVWMLILKPEHAQRQNILLGMPKGGGH